MYTDNTLFVTPVNVAPNIELPEEEEEEAVIVSLVGDRPNTDWVLEN